MSYYEGLGGELMQAKELRADLAYAPGMIERTREEIRTLEERLIRKKELLELLENNPDINRIFDLMR